MQVTPDTVKVVPFLQRELLSNILIAVDPSKTAALPPKGHVPMPGQFALLEGIDVSIAERGGVKVVGVPVRADEYARESAMEVVRNGGTKQLARMLPRVPDKQSANLIAAGSMVQRTSYLERVVDPELSLGCMPKGRWQRLVDAGETARSPGGSRRIVVFCGRVPDKHADPATLSAGAGEPVHGGWRVWAVVG